MTPLRSRSSVALLVALVAVLSTTAPAAHAETARSVASPYTLVDPLDDDPSGGSPDVWADITTFQVRIRAHDVNLRFRLQNLPEPVIRHLSSYTFLVDLEANGPGVDYSVTVTPSIDDLVVSGARPPYATTCHSSLVSNLGQNAQGQGYSLRFRFRCIQGRRAFRTALLSRWVGVAGGDRAPDIGYTPYVRGAA